MPAPRPALPPLPVGFRYDRGFLTPAEEQDLLREIAELDLRPSQYHEYTALRKTACFGLGLSFDGPLAEARFAERRGVELKPRPPAPDFLQQLAARVARHCGLKAGSFPHVLVTEYPPGAPIGWHRDAPPFAAIYGVSLAADCNFRLRPYVSPLERGRAYVDEVEAAVLGGRPTSVGRSGQARSAAGTAQPARGRKTEGSIALTVEPRSLYVMAGPARSAWEHSITPVKQRRFSITLRTL